MAQDPVVFGIGNPLIDVVIQAQDEDLAALGIDKGIMQLVTEERQQEILSHFDGAVQVLRPGGAAPNTIVALAGLGIPAVISGMIGNDEFGTSYDEQVLGSGVASRLTRGEGMTGSSVILVTPDGERSMNTHLGMCQEFSPEALDVELLRRARFLYFTGYMWDTDLQKRAIRRAVSVAKEEKITVVFDLADPFAVQRYRDDFLDLLENDVDMVFANQRETELLYACETAEDCASKLGEHVAVAAMKIGKDGSIIVQNGTRRHAPSRPIQATDSTGAGDMYAAGFLAAYAKGKSAVEAGVAGGRLAEEIIQIIGAQFTAEDLPGVTDRMKGMLQ